MTRVIFALRTFLKLALPYFRSEDRWRAALLLAGVIAAELGLVYVAVVVTSTGTRASSTRSKRATGTCCSPELLIFLLHRCSAPSSPAWRSTTSARR